MTAFVAYRMDRWGGARFVGRSYSETDAETLCLRHSRQAFRTEDLTFKNNKEGRIGKIAGVKDFFYQIKSI